jgi:RNA recognition motif-containing protein
MYGKRKARTEGDPSQGDAPRPSRRLKKTVHNQPWFPPESPEGALSAAKKSKKVPKKVAKTETPANQMFVGGVGDLSEQRLLEHFSQFGPVTTAVVVTDQISGKSRGFGFVSFAEKAGIEKALKQDQVIDGKPVECRLPTRATPPKTSEASAGWECFVGGLPKTVDAAALQNYFRRSGEVLGGRIMIDAVSQQSRGFGFVEFASKDNISAVLEATHTIEGSVVSTKIAEQKKPKLGAPVATSNSIFLGGLPKVVSEQDMRDVCSRFGPVKDVIVKLDAVTGNCRGFSFVSFAKHKGFSKCLEAAQKGEVTFQGRALSVRAAHSKSSKDSYYPKGEKPSKKKTEEKKTESVGD